MKDDITFADFLAHFFYPFFLPRKKYEQFLRMPKENKFVFVCRNTLTGILALFVAILILGDLLAFFAGETAMIFSGIALGALFVFLVLNDVFWANNYMKKYGQEHEHGDETREEMLHLTEIAVHFFYPILASDEGYQRFVSQPREEKLLFITRKAALIVLSVTIGLLGFLVPNMGLFAVFAGVVLFFLTVRFFLIQGARIEHPR